MLPLSRSCDSTMSGSQRVVHARGAGAFGAFKLYESAEDVTSAGVLNDTSRTTPVFVRFSKVLGSRGSADTVRDIRGFVVKFYTHERNWDIAGSDIPVFFIQDAIKFPDVSHAGSKYIRQWKAWKLTCYRARARQQSPAGPDRTQQLLGFPIPPHRSNPHDDVGHERPWHPTLLPYDSRFRREYLHTHQRLR